MNKSSITIKQIVFSGVAIALASVIATVIKLSSLQNGGSVTLFFMLIVHNIHNPFDELSSSAGGFSDRTLLLGTVMQDYSDIKDRIGVYTGQLESQTGGTKIVSLSELCGRDSIITLSCEYQPF